KKQFRRKQKKTTAVPHPSNSTAHVPNEQSVPTHSNDLLFSGEDRLKITDLMDMCTKLSERVIDLEHTKTAQAQEITNFLTESKKRVEYSADESLVRQEDAIQSRESIEDIETRMLKFFIQSTATTAPSTIPKAKGITFRDAGESTTRTPTSVSSIRIKDIGKAKMDDPEVPLKKKDQISLDE
ncbi:hypothetical protein Tco_1462209, partial [Tanacetum coccineum]